MATAETQSIKKDAGIEGDLEFGQKNISSLKRNLLNADEILRLPHNKLIVNIRGNKPLLLDKMIYTEHPLSKKLKDVSVSNYKPNWNANTAVCLVSPIASANGAIIGIDVAACPDPDGIKKFIIF